MNRRNFIQTLVGGLTTAAAVRTFPFRVFSFPQRVWLETREFDPLEICRIVKVPPEMVFSDIELFRIANAKLFSSFPQMRHAFDRARLYSPPDQGHFTARKMMCSFDT